MSRRVRAGREAHQYDFDGNYIDSFSSLTEASIATGASVSDLSSHLYNGHGSAGGFQWSEEKVDNMKPYKKRIKQAKFVVHQYDVKGNYIREFNTYQEIADALGVSVEQARTVKLAYDGKRPHALGYQWKTRKSPKIGSVTIQKRRGQK